LELEVLTAELGMLTATNRKLTASEERRRTWLVGEIATVEAERDHEIVAATELEMQRERQAGVEHVRALIRDWDAREHPKPFSGVQREC